MSGFGVLLQNPSLLHKSTTVLCKLFYLVSQPVAECFAVFNLDGLWPCFYMAIIIMMINVILKPWTFKLEIKMA